LYPDTADRFAPRLGAAWVQYTTWAIILIGVGLRVWQYSAGTSLWLDELAVAQNVVSRPLGELLSSPLAWDQVAPKGFLLAEKAAVLLLGANEWGLRFFPFLCSVAALILFVPVAERVLGRAAPIAVAMFATAGPLIDYAARVKQYSTDVAAAVLLLWVALEVLRRKKLSREVHVAGIIGAIAVWFSQSAILVLAGLGSALLVIAWRNRDGGSKSWIWPLLLWWGGSAAIASAASFASVSAGTRQSLLTTYDLWKLGVPPDSLTQAIQSLWPLHRLTALLARGGQSSLAYPLAPLYLLLAVCGGCILFRRNWPVGLLIFAPFFAALAVAVVRLYPFSDRLILFLLPGIFLGTAATIDLVRVHVSRQSFYAGFATALLLTIPAVFPVIRQLPPYRIDDVKPALSYLQKHHLAGDGIYVFYNAVPAMSFYAPKFGFETKDYTAGGCHRGETRSYLIELDRLRGQRRVWVLILAAHTGARLHGNILRYSDTIGRQLDYFAAPSRTINGLGSPASLYLYDFSDIQRLNAISAATFQVDRQEDVISCDIGPIAMSRIRNFGDHE
jgi:4-amino-4-deoxy-L-arabinose transferase-like glycosyltransferase